MILFHAIQYVLDARGRAGAGKPPYHWSVTTASVKGVSYIAKSAFVRGDIVVVRLYRIGNLELLAERMYVEHGVELFWGMDRLIYDTSTTRSSVAPFNFHPPDSTTSSPSCLDEAKSVLKKYKMTLPIRKPTGPRL